MAAGMEGWHFALANEAQGSRAVALEHSKRVRVTVPREMHRIQLRQKQYQEEQARLAAARSGQSAAATDDAPARGGGARYS